MHMNFLKRIGLISLFIGLFVHLLTWSAAAETVTLEEADLYALGEAAGVYTASWGDVFVVDNKKELWRVNPSTGAYQSFYPLGEDSLADIALLPGDSLWWADYRTAFGSFDLTTHQAQTWFVDDLNPGEEPLNLGPLVYHADRVWLASWYGPRFGLFSFTPQNHELCLFRYPGGHYATDLVSHNGLLWSLDWFTNHLMSFDPANGQLVKYDTGRDVEMFANLVSDGDLFWWAEDKLDSAVVRFNPATGAMTIFTLPAGTHPRNLSLRGGKVWFSDKTGKFGWLDPSTAYGTTTILSGQVLAEDMDPDCVLLGEPETDEVQPLTDTFSWSPFTSEITNPMDGVTVYSLPAGAEPFGIASTADFVWVSDRGRQKLVRMPLEAPEVGYITLIKDVINDNGGTASPDDFNLTLNGQPVASGVEVAVEPGTYTAAETPLSGYTFAGFSGDCNADGQITVAAGESKTCTLTNTFQTEIDGYSVFLPLILH